MSFHVPRIRLNLLMLEEYVSTRRNDVGLGIQYSIYDTRQLSLFQVRWFAVCPLNEAWNPLSYQLLIYYPYSEIKVKGPV